MDEDLSKLKASNGNKTDSFGDDSNADTQDGSPHKPMETEPVVVEEAEEIIVSSPEAKVSLVPEDRPITLSLVKAALESAEICNPALIQQSMQDTMIVDDDSSKSSKDSTEVSTLTTPEDTMPPSEIPSEVCEKSTPMCIDKDFSEDSSVTGNTTKAEPDSSCDKNIGLFHDIMFDLNELNKPKVIDIGLKVLQRKRRRSGKLPAGDSPPLPSLSPSSRRRCDSSTRSVLFPREQTSSEDSEICASQKESNLEQTSDDPKSSGSLKKRYLASQSSETREQSAIAQSPDKQKAKPAKQTITAMDLMDSFIRAEVRRRPPQSNVAVPAQSPKRESKLPAQSPKRESKLPAQSPKRESKLPAQSPKRESKPKSGTSPLTGEEHRNILIINTLTSLTDRLVSYDNYFSNHPLRSVPRPSSQPRPLEEARAPSPIPGPSNRATLGELEDDFRRGLRGLIYANQLDVQEEVHSRFHRPIREMRDYLRRAAHNRYMSPLPIETVPVSDEPVTLEYLREVLQELWRIVRHNISKLMEYTSALLYWCLDDNPVSLRDELVTLGRDIDELYNSVENLRRSTARLMNRLTEQIMHDLEVLDLTFVMAISADIASMHGTLEKEIRFIGIEMGFFR